MKSTQRNMKIPITFTSASQQTVWIIKHIYKLIPPQLKPSLPKNILSNPSREKRWGGGGVGDMVSEPRSERHWITNNFQRYKQREIIKKYIIIIIKKNAANFFTFQQTFQLGFLPGYLNALKVMIFCNLSSSFGNIPCYCQL